MAQFVGIEADAHAGAGGQVDVEIGKAQRLGGQIFDQDLRAEMLATPGQRTEPGENLKMRGRGKVRRLRRVLA